MSPMLKKILLAIICLIALYGIIIFVRKVSSDKKEKNLKYFFEPYHAMSKKCKCGSMKNGVCRVCKN